MVIVGLGIDIAGAYLIISPLLYMSNKNYPKGNPSPDEIKPVYGMTDMKHGYDQDVSAENKARWGLGLLIFGFILQIIGNLLLDQSIKKLMQL